MEEIKREQLDELERISGFTKEQAKAEVMKKVEEKMNIEKDNSENIKISFVAKYMMDALKSFDADSVTISFVGEVKPIILKSSEDEGLTQLVLPIRTY